MSHSFFLSQAAQALTLPAIEAMSDTDAFETFKRIRWHETNGEPVCPRCGSKEAYSFNVRSMFKCKNKACKMHFSPTSATIFSSRKLPYRDLLSAIAIFVNGKGGVNMLQMSKDLKVQYKTAWDLIHRMRESLRSERTQ